MSQSEAAPGRPFVSYPGRGGGGLEGGGWETYRALDSIHQRREKGWTLQQHGDTSVIAPLLLVDKSGHYGLPEVFVTGI